MNSSQRALFSGSPIINRDQCISLLRAALTIDEIRFARQAALAWLGSYPGDLQVNLLYAQSVSKAGQFEQAISILEDITLCDPEYVEAVEALAQAQGLRAYPLTKIKDQKSVPQAYANLVGWLMALDGNLDVVHNNGLSHKVLREKSLADWSRKLLKARHALEQGELDLAEREIHDALLAEASTPLIDVTHLRILNARMAENRSGSQMLRSLAAYYRQRWPGCLYFTLLLADALMDCGESDNAVALLHEAVSGDVQGQVALRLWGTEHPYRNLWPERLELELDLPIPASVSSVLGWNRLPEFASVQDPAGPLSKAAELTGKSQPAPAIREPVTPPVVDVENNKEAAETLLSVQMELDKLGVRLNRPSLVNSDGRFPVYVVMTTREGLQKRYGEATAGILEAEMLRLVSAVGERRDWASVLFYADEGVVLANGARTSLERKATRGSDPWGVKLALTDLDAALQKRGERIGALLIVGGPDVVPFHKLPNPVDDADIEVASDNPYGTRDENYFIPEWPVGRLPDGAPSSSGNAQPLLYALSGLTTRHKSIANSGRNSGWFRRWSSRFYRWATRKNQSGNSRRSSFGITAAIWRQASLTVFRPIGDPRALRVSPPNTNGTLGSNGRQHTPLPAGKLGYFNLHGLADAPEWFGQRESGSVDATAFMGIGEDYPVALRPADVMNSGRAPQVVFSEACYGAHILNKNIEEAMSLKFIQAGTYAMIGSTCISYGSISSPLIAADYLGHAFWTNLKDGIPAGEALRRAKVALARDMHNRQGYLDGEDQKTLISFVLYGDPLAIPAGLEVKAKPVVRNANPPANLKTVCDRLHDPNCREPVPEDIQEFVKSVVKQYLPGMENARLTMSMEHLGCEGHHPISHTGQQAMDNYKRIDLSSQRQGFQLARKVITLSKDVPNTAHVHHHYARLTLDAQGKLVKLVVSR